MAGKHGSVSLFLYVKWFSFTAAEVKFWPVFKREQKENSCISFISHDMIPEEIGIACIERCARLNLRR